MVGVMSYSFAISAMSSMISTMDHREHQYKQSLDMLGKIDLTYNMSTELYLETIKALNYKYKSPQTLHDKQEWLNKLPRKLRKSLNKVIHFKTIMQIPNFEHQSLRFLDYISTFLSLRKYSQDQYIMREGEEANEIYFILKGQVEYVLPKYNDIPYMIVPKGQHFGELDVLIPKKNAKRYFSAKAKEDVEVLVLTKTDLLRVAEKFKEEVIEIFKFLNERNGSILNEKTRVEQTLKQKKRKMSKLFNFEVQTMKPEEENELAPVTKNESSFLDSLDSQSLSAISSVGVGKHKISADFLKESVKEKIQITPPKAAIQKNKVSEMSLSNSKKEFKIDKISIIPPIQNVPQIELNKPIETASDTQIKYFAPLLNQKPVGNEDSLGSYRSISNLIEDNINGKFEKIKESDDSISIEEHRDSNLSLKITSGLFPFHEEEES